MAKRQWTERQAKIKALRRRLANLTEEERRALTERGLIATVEGRTLSVKNTMLVYLQSNGRTPSVVGGYQQWRRAGKTVRKGEHGFTIWFPVKGDKEDEDSESTRFFTGTVFDISQVDNLDAGAASPIPGPQPARLPVSAAAQTQPEDNLMKGWATV